MASESRPAPAQAIDDILARFVRYHPDRIDLSLDRMYRLLADLGDPHTKLPPVIHVAGTNGKGSTVAVLRAALEASGKVVSAYTSPHLIRFAERYRIAGTIPDDDTLLALLEEIEAVNAEKPITAFEITTAAAFLAFARALADIVILEVGLGGRFDATNVVDRPLATIITRIAMDHMDFLGNTITAIAGEKAAIQKPSIPSITGPQNPEAMAVITAFAETVGAPLYRAGQEWTVAASPESGGFVYKHAGTQWHLPDPALSGQHQRDNTATAAACLDICNLPGVTPATIATGLQEIDWPGRLQRLSDGPLTRLLPDGWELWVDAAHNPSGAMAAVVMFGARGEADGLPLHLVVAIARDKDVEGFLAPFRDGAASATAVPLPDAPRMRSTDALAACFDVAGLPGQAATSLPAALEALAQQAKPARVLVTGSHLLVGAALSFNSTDRLDR